MPSGAVHARDSRVLAVVSSVPILFYSQNLAASALVAIGCLSGIPLSPDLDHHHRTYAERYYIFGRLWGWFWMPYEKLLPHRSPFSHYPILGTLLRQFYLLSAVWLVLYLTGWEEAGLLRNLAWLGNKWWYQWWLLGLLLSDTMHWAQDYRPRFRVGPPWGR